MNEVPLPPIHYSHASVSRSASAARKTRPERKPILQTLQDLDESMKRRVLVISSAVAMIVVVYAWVGYVGAFIVVRNPAGQQAAIQTAAVPVPAPAPAQAGGSQAKPSAAAGGFWRELESGAVSAYHGMAQAVTKPMEYDVKPKQ
ncbi:MAG TPA: hypothetical protein VMT99_02940 [Candidatus Paceibacterota bacterium]|nr:hypothetical protein [Candidatus Paceibacterota bacterium]